MLKIMLHQGLEIDNFSGVHITFKQSVNQIILSHFFFFILLDIVQLFCVLFLVFLRAQLIYFTSEKNAGLTRN